MKFLSICSGIEAASVASAPMGWEAVGFSEIEPFPCAVLKHHYPDVPNYGDMKKFDEWPDMDIDLLCGGTPCQAFSVAGQRKGLEDARGNLTLTFCAIADRYNPEWIMWENVPGVLSSKDNAFGCFLAELCGADSPIESVAGRWPNAGVVAGPKRTAAWRVLDAQYVRVDGYPYAVPQRRRRVFVVACPGTTGDPATVLFEPEGLRRNTPPRRETGEGAAKTLNGSSGERGYPDPSDGNGGGLVSISEVYVPEVCGCLQERDSKGTDSDTKPGHLIPVSCAEVAPCMTSGGAPFERTGNERTECEAIVATTQYGEHVGQREPCVAFPWQSGYGADASDVCPTQIKNQVMDCHHLMQVRLLTPVECERLMGFPDNYTRIPWRGKPAELCPDGPRYKALGNSWAVNCARWIFRRIEMVASCN